MQFKRTILAAAVIVVALALAALVPSCDQSQAQAHAAGGGQRTAEPAAPAPQDLEPDAARVLVRSRERWRKILEACDATDDEGTARWIEVYDFLAPARKKVESLTSFIGTKNGFYYDQPKEPKLLKIERNEGGFHMAYVEGGAIWLAYKHPVFKEHAPEGGENHVEPMDQIEEWIWTDGDWSLVKVHRKFDFFQANPDFFEPRPDPNK